MSERTAKRLRREQVGPPKPKQFFKPMLLKIKGEETYIPRAQRRKLFRKFMTDIRKGRINLNDRRSEEERQSI